MVFNNYIVLIYISLFVLFLNTSDSFDYCSITCGGKKHVMCEYQEGGGPECQSFRRGLMDREKLILIELHNDYRTTTAMGKGDVVPRAANMMEMAWSEEAAMIAQRWADQCTKVEEQDECRSLQNKEIGGQNVGVFNDNPTNLDSYNMLRRIVSAWYQTGSNLSASSLKSYKLDPSTSQYSQLVWATSSTLGCGYTSGKLNDREVYRLVCNYYPAGNIEGQSVYLVGKPCTKCTFVQCNKRMNPLLCIREKKDTVYNRGQNSSSYVQSQSFYIPSLVSIYVIFYIG